MKEKKYISDIPELMQEWDYEANADLDPNKITYGSHIKAWWKCSKCGYKWQTQIQVRTQGHSSCHRCTNTALIHGVNDLETLFPEIAKEWHPTKNGSLKASDIKPGRRYKAWWKCSKCGHEWQISPNNRTSNKSGCPKCLMGKRTSYPEQVLYYYVKQLFPDAINGFKAPFLGRMELDIYIPSFKWAIEYDGNHWHKKEKLKLEQKKYQKCHENKIKLFRIREEMAELGSDIADEQISIVKFNKKENLEETIRYIIKRLNFSRKPIDINLTRDETTIRATYQNESRNSIAVLYPNLVAEWDYKNNGELTPDRVNIGSKYKAHWICPTCGYKYRASVNNRTSRNSGCIKCAYKKNATAKSKAVYMIDPKTKRIVEKFISISDASRKMNISSGHIIQVCQGARHKTGGYIWQYADEKDIRKYQKNKNQLEFDLK